MGQILLIHGEDPAAVAALHRRAREAFRGLYGVSPAQEVIAGNTRVIRLQSPSRETGGLFQEMDAWSVSAGTCIAHDRLREGGLREIALALRAGSDLAGVARLFEGYFLLAAGDAEEIALITDRLGLLHAYRTQVGRCLLVSTSALVLALLRGSALDPEAAREFLASGSVFEQRSLFQDVAKLAPGSIYRFRHGRLHSCEVWFDLKSLLYDGSSSGADVPQIAEALLEALQEIFRAFPKPLLDLTGGVDTRNILAAARRIGVDFATVVNGPDDDPDVVLANRIARELSLDHRQQVPGRDYQCASYEALVRASALCDGECDILEHAPVLAIQERTAADFLLSVSGTFGEICHGSGWLHAVERHGGLDFEKVVEIRYIQSPWTDRLTRDRFRTTLAEHFLGVVARDSERLDGLPTGARADYLENVQRSRWAGRIASSTLRIRPCATPFVFERFLRVVLSVPPAARFGGNTALALLQLLDSRLSAMPLVSGLSSRPHPLNGLRRRLARAALRNGGSSGSALLARLYPTRLPGALRSWNIWSVPEIRDLLHAEQMLTRDLYDFAFLRSFLDLCQKRRYNPASMLGRILSLEVAARTLRTFSSLAR